MIGMEGLGVAPEDELQRIIGRIVDLPTLPVVVMRLLSAVENPRSDAREVNRIMSNDPALAARILKLVNSSFYAMPSTVTSIQQAVVILGYNTVRSLALSASVFDAFSDTGFSHEKFWLQSVACALMCENLGARSDKLNIGTCFSAGLLHDIGKIIFEQYAPERFSEVITLAKKNGISFAVAQNDLLPSGQAEVGYWLAEKWKLPELTRQAIRYQDRLEECPEEYRPLAAAVQLSYQTCRMLGWENGGDFDAVNEVPEALWDELEISERDMVRAELEGQTARATDLFSHIKL